MRKLLTLVLVLVALTAFSVTGLAALKVGEELPNFELKDLQGKTVKISDYRGQYVIYDVWATWCGYCIPALRDYQKNLKMIEAAGVKVVAVSVDARAEDVKEFVAKEGWTFTVLHDRMNTPTRLWEVRGIPAIFVADPQGKLIYTHVGLAEFDKLWVQVQKAMEMGKNPPKQVSGLQEGTYKTQLVDIVDLYVSEQIDAELQARFFTAKSGVKLAKEVAYQTTPQYTTLKVGDKVMAVAAEATKSSKVPVNLYVDLNHNLNLTESEERMYMSINVQDDGTPISQWAGELKFNLEKGVTLRYQFMTYFWPSGNEYYFVPMDGYQAEVKTEKGAVKLLIVDFTANGVFGDDGDLVLVDLNQNGTFEDEYGVERFTMKEGIQLKDRKYQVKIKQNGKEISIAVVK